METPLFLIFLFIHLVGLIIGFGSVIALDTFGFLWLLKKTSLPFVMKVAQVTQRLIWLGWYMLVASGINLLILKGYIDNLTKVKLFFVALIGLNGIFLHYIKKAFERLSEHETIPPLYRFRMGLATIISQLGWWGAITIGFLHRHWQHDIPWPDNYLAVIFIIAGILGGTALIGEKILNKKPQTHKSEAKASSLL